MSDSTCPLCGSTSARDFHARDDRSFLRCAECQLVFVPRRFHLSREAERAVYELHDNRPDDPRYRAFLSRLFAPLRDRLRRGAMGLDFGCGPGPTLSAMFRESGFECADYDPFFRDDRSLLTRQYDFVVREVALHPRPHPRGVLRRRDVRLDRRALLLERAHRVVRRGAAAISATDSVLTLTIAQPAPPVVSAQRRALAVLVGGGDTDPVVGGAPPGPRALR